MDAAQILVIILAATLAVFLLLAIALLIYLIKIARQIKRVTTAAERAADKFDGIMSLAQRAIAPAMVTKLITSLVQQFTDRHNRKDEDD